MGRMKEFIIGFIIVVLFGVMFQATVNWDQGYSWHPDERMIVMTGLKLDWLFPWEKQFYQTDSVFNPKFFAYGSLPIYTVTLFKYWMGSDFYKVTAALRWVSFVFLIGLAVVVKKMAWQISRSKKIAFLAFWFVFLSFFTWQNAHFYTVDLGLAFWFSFVMYRLILWWQGRRSEYDQFLIGLGLAAGMATKFTMVMIFPAVVLVIGIAPKEKMFEKIKQFINVGAVGLVGFFIFQPYGVIDFGSYKSQILAQLRMGKSAYTFPYTLQYVGTKAYLYPLKQILLWGLGPFLAGLSLLGVWQVLRKKEKYINTGLILLAGFSLFYFGVVGRSAVKFMRYYLPIYPMLIILAAIGIASLTQKGRWGRLGASVLVLLTVVWWGSLAAIQLQEPTRLQAARWLDSQYPKIKRLGVEHWDDRLPTRKPFKMIEFPMYNSERSKGLRQRKARIIKNKAGMIDAYVLASPRLYKPLLKLSKKFPAASSFYESLFGFKTQFTV
ncbi:MAG: hypothetical protein GXP43_03765, partial [bacterium]|nr:hypothetical protein [bacterium]